MKKTIITLIAILLFSFNDYAQEQDSTQLELQKIEESLVYKTGKIELASDNVNINVPRGFRFLDKEQSAYVLTDLWGNPKDDSVLGLLVPENKGILEEGSWLYSISFEEIGYVEDDDADDIDYSDLLEDMQDEMKEYNPERVSKGYEPVDFVGWASSPYYDKNRKVLHWAKEIKFGTDSINTLNYNLRVLGRKGVLVLNAVAYMPELAEVKSSISRVIESIEFKEGHKYENYIAGTDNIAQWTIGGLIAGKLLAKSGILIMIIKFWKLITFAFLGAGTAFFKFFKKKKKDAITVRDQE